MSVLVVYQNVPESTELFLIPNSVWDEHKEKISLCNNRLLNTRQQKNVQDALEWLNAATQPTEYVDSYDDGLKQAVGLFMPWKLELSDGQPFEVAKTVTHVVVTGIVL